MDLVLSQNQFDLVTTTAPDTTTTDLLGPPSDDGWREARWHASVISSDVPAELQAGAAS